MKTQNPQPVSAKQLTDIFTVKSDTVSTASHPLLLDVRTPMEYELERHSCKHIHIPLSNKLADELANKITPMKTNNDSEESIKTRSVYILCRSGARAKRAAEQLNQAGFSSVFWIEGGLENCKSEGHEIKTATESVSSTNAPFYLRFSLERQVRMAAGGLLILFWLLYVLGVSFGPHLMGLIGAGLFFAAYTNQCAMATVLSKASWNKVRNTACSVDNSLSKSN